MGATDPRVDAYVKQAPAFAKPILAHLRTLVHEACPGVEETIKWSNPAFDYKGPFCGIAAFKQHVTFGFWKWELLKDRLPGSGDTANPANQFGRLRSIGDLPSDSKLKQIIKTAAKLNDDGVKAPPMRTGPRPPLAAPKDLLQAIHKNKKAMATFDNFPPGQRREYIAWVLEAKQPETRRRRIVTAVEWMSEGKIRNWKYAR